MAATSPRQEVASAGEVEYGLLLKKRETTACSPLVCRSVVAWNYGRPAE